MVVSPAHHNAQHRESGDANSRSLDETEGEELAENTLDSARKTTRQVSAMRLMVDTRFAQRLLLANNFVAMQRGSHHQRNEQPQQNPGIDAFSQFHINSLQR